jgi:hypothetical protein
MLKNKIEKTENGYILTTIDGQVYPCTRWFEKKVEKWHVVVPKEAREVCGRTYIRESYFDNSDIYEFETKTEHREGLGSGGWKSRLTEEELKTYEECERIMNGLKEVAMSRQPKELTEEEKLLRDIAKLQAKLNKVREG